MVDKLNLQAMAHPHPYNIHWVNQGKGIQVNSRCFISFSIGTSYQDELWFGIIPMDTCHIMFGRPWLFDRKVIHDGYLNTYSFSKEGKKVTLVPIPPSKLLKPSNAPPTNLLLKSYPQIESYHTLHPPLTHSVRVYKPAVPQKSPHDIFLQRSLLHEVDPLHAPNEDLLNLRTNSSQPGENDGGPSPSLNLITRSKFKSKIQEWVYVLLAQPSELSVWAYGISPGFVTRLEQGPDLELP